jgi:PKHD-type hydroxylase
MSFHLEDLLNADELRSWTSRLQAAAHLWRAGEETAGWHARAVKHNRQLDREASLHQELAAVLEERLGCHPLLQAAAFPRRIHGLLFSCCGPGEGYGRHVDNAWMAAGRSDLSFTLFLSDPDSYGGGELVLETDAGERSVKLPAGTAFVYPSTLLHRVEPVRQGERLVAVGWIESRIRQEEQRQLLFDLDTARRALFQRSGKDEVFDLVSRSYSNLLRRWEC